MGIFGAAPCPHCDYYRAQCDRAQAELSAVLTEYQSVVKEALAVKRHDLGMPPAGQVISDPTAVLGPLTQAAIEDMSQGFPDQRSYLTNYAIVQVKAGLARGASAEDVDASVAHAIREGDAG